MSDWLLWWLMGRAVVGGVWFSHFSVVSGALGVEFHLKSSVRGSLGLDWAFTVLLKEGRGYITRVFLLL